MKIVLALLHFSQLRNFSSVVEELAGRGHEIVIAAEEEDSVGGVALAKSLAARWPQVSVAMVPGVEDDPTVDLAARLRIALDYIRFHEEPYATAPKLRERIRGRVPRLLLKVHALAGAKRAGSVLSAIEESLAPSDSLTSWLTRQSPDVLLLASLTHYRSLAPELQRAATSLRIPTAACIYSWDHLSSKALLRRVPGAVIVWNDVQADEAVRLHKMPASRVVVTGAQCYDQWYGRQASQNYLQFCRTVGLDAARPFVLYVCSALTPSPDEPGFVREWIAALRGAGSSTLSDIGVLVRPHPERSKEWASIEGLPENVVVRGGQGGGDAARAEYFDTIFHSRAVVGLVTSAFLEAAIIERPVFTITLPRFTRHQHDMQHFRYLLEVAGGLPAVADSLPDHVQQLAAVLGGDDTWRVRQAEFLKVFVRPVADDETATVRFADAVETLRDAPVAAPERSRPRLADWALHASVLGPVRRAMLDDYERIHARGVKKKQATKRQKSRAKQRNRFAGAAKRLLLGRSNSQDRV